MIAMHRIWLVNQFNPPKPTILRCTVKHKEILNISHPLAITTTNTNKTVIWLMNNPKLILILGYSKILLVSKPNVMKRCYSVMTNKKPNHTNLNRNSLNNVDLVNKILKLIITALSILMVIAMGHLRTVQILLTIIEALQGNYFIFW